jgi:hypothetical protein
MILRTYDGGNSWSSLFLGRSESINDLSVCDGAIISVGSNGLFAVSRDEGTTWQLFHPGTSNDLNAVVTPGNGRILCIGEYGVIIKTDMPPQIIQPEGDGDISQRNIARQIKSFCEKPSIEFESRQITEGRIEVFDVSGRMIISDYKYLAEGNLPVINTSGTSLSSGLYFCRMFSDKRIVIRKFLVLR